jgi:hypothetical protein
MPKVFSGMTHAPTTRILPTPLCQRGIWGDFKSRNQKKFLANAIKRLCLFLSRRYTGMKILQAIYELARLDAFFREASHHG